MSRDTTVAVILGASKWPHSPKLPSSEAFEQAAFGLIEYLIDPSLFGLPNDGDHLLNLFNDQGSPNEINRRLTTWLRSAQSSAETRRRPIRDLILYYVGHGGFTPGGEQAYYLAIQSTEVDNEGISSLRMTDLARTIRREARSLRRFLILDCCFAESAYGLFQSEGGYPADAAHAKSLMDFPGSGTALLCSSSARDVSLAPKGEKYTMFSGCLLQVLSEGDPNATSSLSLEQVGTKVAQRISTKYRDVEVRPKVSAPDEAEGDIAGFPIFPNALYRGVSTDVSATVPANPVRHSDVPQSSAVSDRGVLEIMRWKTGPTRVFHLRDCVRVQIVHQRERMFAFRAAKDIPSVVILPAKPRNGAKQGL